MHRRYKLLAVVVLSALSQSTHAIPFTWEARSLGMGGTSVAAADLATAAWANPAMLTNQRAKDDFSLLIGVGAFVRDTDDLIGDVDDFQDADDRREDAIDAEDVLGAARAILDMYSAVNEIEGKIIAPEATVLIAFGIAFDSFAMAVSARVDAIAGGVVTDLSCDVTKCGAEEGLEELLSDEFNILNVDGVLATELGVSFATDFRLWDRKVSIGVKPKIVELEAFSESESILTVSTDSDYAIDQDNKEDLGTFSTIDFGLAMDVSDSVRLGLNVRNLITDEFKLFDQTLNLDTEVRIGAAYHSRIFTLAVDFDLTENEPLLPNDSFDGLKSRLLAIGAEYKPVEYVKLRLGAAKNVASGISSGADDVVYTAGIGFWLGFNLDIAAIIADDKTIGAFVQTGFRF
jgi:hypothetical protein